MNAKMTKLKKNYVALATLIAVLGVIFALFLASNSFANENEENSTINISGRLVDLNSNPVEGAEIYGYSSDIEGGQFTGTSSSTGEFSIAVSVPGGTLNSFSFQAIKSGIPGQKAGLRGTYGYSTPVTEDVDTGDVSMNYYVGYAESINGDYVAENAFGK